MANSTLGEKLLELRSNRNLTQQQVSDALHIGRATYAYYEGNKRTPDLGMLLSICKFYGIEISELINENIIPVSTVQIDGDEIKGIGFTRISRPGMGLLSGVIEGALEMSIKEHEVKPPFTKIEKELIANFRQLNSENKEEVCHLIKYKLRKQKKK